MGTSDIFVGHVFFVVVVGCFVCLFVFCFSHNNRDLLRATAVTPKWNGYQNKSQHRKLTGEEKPPAGNRSDEILFVVVAAALLLLLLLLLLFVCFSFLFVFKALLQQGLYKSTCHHHSTLN